jgi:peptide-methionine (S)-S-oxide reductase
MESNERAQATFGGGCFWCTEAVFKELRGVERVESGYAGGAVDAPSYEAVCTGRTGHAEVVRVTYDPSVVSYRDLLEVFFATHDPTQLDRQGADVGTQYRSAVFYADEAQRATAEGVIAELARDGVFDAPVVTTLEPLGTFWPAERYHQDYYARNPRQGYCQVVIAPKLAKFRQRFAELRG